MPLHKSIAMKPKSHNKSLARQSAERVRLGAACVELAVTLPVIVLLVFASLEGANMLFLRQAVVQSAYETAKSAAKGNGDQALATTLGRQVLTSRSIVAPTITFAPANVNNLAAGTPFTVTVSVPGDSRSITGIGPFNGLTIQAQATMLKE
jgi:Flp pilus assembly protein TadG